MATQATEHEERVSQIHARVGRNVVRVQSLEVGLKTLLPFLDLRGASHCLDGLLDRQTEVARNTLGQLIGAFLSLTSSDDPRFPESVQRILSDRNNLVHHFHTTLGVRTSTQEGCAWVIAQLDEQFEAIKLFERLVTGLLLEVLHALRDTTFKNSPGYDDFAGLCLEYSTVLRAAGISDPTIERPNA
jgi:hypothetical protein